MHYDPGVGDQNRLHGPWGGVGGGGRESRTTSMAPGVGGQQDHLNFSGCRHVTKVTQSRGVDKGGGGVFSLIMNILIFIIVS